MSLRKVCLCEKTKDVGLSIIIVRYLLVSFVLGKMRLNARLILQPRLIVTSRL